MRLALLILVVAVLGLMSLILAVGTVEPNPEPVAKVEGRLVPPLRLETTRTTTPAPVTTINTTSTSMPRSHETAPIEDDRTAIAAAFARFGPTVVAQAERVAGCESAGDPTGGRMNAAAVNGPHAGLFQISRLYHATRVTMLGFTWSQMLQPTPNAIVAANIYAESGWHPWSCRWAS